MTMRYVAVHGCRLSAIGLGTWQFGSKEWNYGRSYEEKESAAIVDKALDLGVNFIDTAEAYGWGRSERAIGRALGSRRQEAFLASKVFPIMPVNPVVKDRARRSAARLGVDTIDLYQIHWPNPVVPLNLTMRAMAGLQRDGVVKHVGVSNFSLAAWQQAERFLPGNVLSNQVRYNLLDRRIEADILPWAQETGHVVVAYSPLAQGLLSGRYSQDNIPGGLRAYTSAFQPGNLAIAEPLIEALRRISRDHGATPTQVALAWLIRRPNVVVIPGAGSLSQLQANVESADLELSDDEDSELDEASKTYRASSGLAASVSRAVRAGQLLASRTVERYTRPSKSAW
ncbi:MAG: aldo/keto reductase [Acidimicrobiales bacterium]